MGHVLKQCPQKNEPDPGWVSKSRTAPPWISEKIHTRERQESEQHEMAALTYYGAYGTGHGSNSHNKPAYLKTISLGAIWVTNIDLLSHRKEKLILIWAYYEHFQRNLKR